MHYVITVLLIWNNENYVTWFPFVYAIIIFCDLILVLIALCDDNIQYLNRQD